jgi:hypothetical protein
MWCIMMVQPLRWPLCSLGKILLTLSTANENNNRIHLKFGKAEWGGTCKQVRTLCDTGW